MVWGGTLAIDQRLPCAYDVTKRAPAYRHHHRGFVHADTIAAALLSGLVMFTAFPKAKDLAGVLLLTTPPSTKEHLYKLLREV